MYSLQQKRKTNQCQQFCYIADTNVGIVAKLLALKSSACILSNIHCIGKCFKFTHFNEICSFYVM